MDILALLRRHGNTLICEGSNGRIFEVTPAGEIVWEYVNPFPNLTPKIPNSPVENRGSRVRGLGPETLVCA